MNSTQAKIQRLVELQMETVCCSWTISFSKKRNRFVIHTPNMYKVYFEDEDLDTALGLAITFIESSRTQIPRSPMFRIDEKQYLDKFERP